MKKPYNDACKTPVFLSAAFLVKKETVSGIIGNTHGVSKAIKPPKKPSRNKLSSPLFLSCFTEELFSFPQSVNGLSKSIEETNRLVLGCTKVVSKTILNFSSSGKKLFSDQTS
ncbi:MAG: hypothetical protein ABIP69_03415 [Ferruginibacter sp.]